MKSIRTTVFNHPSLLVVQSDDDEQKQQTKPWLVGVSKEDLEWMKTYMKWPEKSTTPLKPLPLKSREKNTCYLDAVLQCLAYIPLFAQYLNKRRRDWRSGAKDDVRAALSRVIEEMHTRSKKEAESERVVEQLNSLGFDRGEEDDAHLLLIRLLQKLREEELKSAELKESEHDDTCTTVDTIFRGYFRRQVQCECGHTVDKFDHFSDWKQGSKKK